MTGLGKVHRAALVLVLARHLVALDWNQSLVWIHSRVCVVLGYHRFLESSVSRLVVDTSLLALSKIFDVRCILFGNPESQPIDFSSEALEQHQTPNQR